MAYLAGGGYRVLPLAELADRLAARAPLPDRAVVLTFDDGFRDNYEHAFPVLQRYAMPATIFLVAGYVGTERLPVLTGAPVVPRPLDWAQVREMHGRGIEFGSHTLTHPPLSRLPHDAAWREIRESRQVIEDHLGAPVRAFCYPRGDFDRAVKAMVREAGYRVACTTRPGVNAARSDPFALRRTYVGPHDTPAEFARKLEGGYDALQVALYLWQRLGRWRRPPDPVGH